MSRKCNNCYSKKKEYCPKDNYHTLSRLSDSGCSGKGHGCRCADSTSKSSCKRDVRTRKIDLVTNLTDPLLINAMGILSLHSGLYVANNTTGNVRVYDFNGTLVNTIDVNNGIIGSAPTSIILNCTNGFNIPTTLLPATLLIANQFGYISAYNSSWNSTSSTPVITTPGASYTGLAIAGSNLYAVDYNANQIDVFDFNFNPVVLPGTPFVDPDLPIGLSQNMINVVNIKGLLYVVYNIIDFSGQDSSVINVFDINGILIRRLITANSLNAPWDIILAPSFLNLPCDSILVSNRGDGRIVIYNKNGVFIGIFKNCDNTDLIIDGLWGLTSNITNVFFASGPNNELNGLVGKNYFDCYY